MIHHFRSISKLDDKIKTKNCKGQTQEDEGPISVSRFTVSDSPQSQIYKFIYKLEF